jgi:hypothetical protein
MRITTAIAFGALASALDAQLAQMFSNPHAYPAAWVATPHVLIADFTGDGKLDVAVDATDATTSAIDVYPGDGAGGLLSPLRTAFVNPAYAPNQEPTRLIAAVDLNQDGYVDLITTTAYTCGLGPMRFHLNQGNGLFSSFPLNLGMTGSGLGSVVVRDLDGDGLPEVITANGTLNTRVFTVSGSTPTATMITTLNAVSGLVAVGDFNGDGLKDVAVVGVGFPSGSITVFVQGPPLTFTPAGPFPFGYNALVFCDPMPNLWAVAADSDGDGDDDLIIHQTGNPPRVFPGDPALVLGPSVGPLPTTITLNGEHEPLAADFDSDGVGDLIANNAMLRIPVSTTPSWLQIPCFTGPLGWCLSAAGAADLDGDGDLDLIYASDATVAVAFGETRRTPGCVTSGPGPGFLVGSAFPGNAAYALKLTGLQPGAPAVLGLSTAPGLAAAGPCLAAIGLGPNELILPAGSLGIASADAAGVATVAIPIPNVPALLQTEYYAQWLAADPAGPWSFGGASYLLSLSRKIAIW